MLYSAPMAGMSESDWRALMRYYRRCVSSEMAGAVHPIGAEGRLFALPTDGVELEVGAWAVRNPSRFLGMVRSAEQTQRQRSLYLGYPVVVVEGQADGRTRATRHVAPLLTVELSVQPLGTGSTAWLPATDELPQVHLGVLGQLGVDDENIDAVAAAMPFDGLLDGPLAAISTELEELLGLRVLAGDAAPPPTQRPLAPGIHDRAIVYVDESGQMIRGLLEELEALEDRWREAHETGLAWLLGHPPPPPSPGSMPPAIAPWPLNPAQEQAVQLGMTGPLTMVTGPPGTGKSQLIADVVATSWAAARSVCVSSTNNRAVDVVSDRLGALAPGLLIRSGNTTFRDAAQRTIERLANATRSARSPVEVRGDVARNWSALHAGRARVEQRCALDRDMEEVLAERDACARTTGADLAWLARLSDFEIGDRAATGQRLSRARLFAGWRQRRWLRGLRIPPLEGTFPVAIQLLAAEHRRRRILADPTPPLDDVLEADRRERRHFVDDSRRLACELVDAEVQAGHGTLVSCSRAVVLPRLGHGASFAALQRVLRGWATTSLSAHGSFPLTPRLFNLVVIDEASQCSIPAILPLLYRARAVMIVGDPRQLTHVSRVDERTNRRHLTAAGLGTEWAELGRLDYRHSIFHALDAVATERVLLDEHYRCHPAIAEAANRLFYEGNLTILTDPNSVGEKPPFRWNPVRGTVSRWHGESSAVNQDEARAVVDVVAELLSDGVTSLGVVTPFRGQAEVIRSLLRRASLPLALPPEWLSASVGTAHTFQGGERDVIVFSPVVSEATPQSVRGFLDKTPNLVNVALTRARQRFIVVGDADACTATGGKLAELTRTVLQSQAEWATEREERYGRIDSDAERALHHALVAAALPVQAKPRWHNIEFDFAVRDGPHLIDVECDGAHHLDAHGRARASDRSRDDVLSSHGITVLRFPDWRCRHEPEAVAAEVSQRLARLREGVA
jgi:very-short-patch-repair endonuclease